MMDNSRNSSPKPSESARHPDVLVIEVAGGRKIDLVDAREKIRNSMFSLNLMPEDAEISPVARTEPANPAPVGSNPPQAPTPALRADQSPLNSAANPNPYENVYAFNNGHPIEGSANPEPEVTAPGLDIEAIRRAVNEEAA